MSDELTGKFIVADSLVTVKWTPKKELSATDGESNWDPTLKQIKEHYTPVSATAERFCELVEQRREKRKNKR